VGVESPERACGRLEIPAAATGASTELTSTTARLNGSVTPNGRATGLRFAWGPTPALGSVTPTQDVGAGDAPAAGTADLTGLEPETTYHFRVEAIREDGQVAVAGAPGTFTTPPVPATPSPAPVGEAPPVAAAPVGRIIRAQVLQTRRPGAARARVSLRLTVSARLRVRVALARQVPGIRRGRVCVAAPRVIRTGARRCIRQLRVGRPVSRVLPRAGRHALALGGAGLSPGRYAVTVTTPDAAAGTRPRMIRFTVRGR
jgi:hypothetical protein